MEAAMVSTRLQRGESHMALELLPVVEQAAIECAKLMGSGDRDGADQAAVTAMRQALDSADIDGTIVIGEGERDEAPMLYVGERVGDPASPYKVDIAVDPLEGTNLCATGANNAIAVMAVAAAEVCVGLGLIVAMARRNLDLDVDRMTELRG